MSKYIVTMSIDVLSKSKSIKPPTKKALSAFVQETLSTRQVDDRGNHVARVRVRTVDFD